MRIIHAERDSVCIGDDVTAPNAKDFFFIQNKSTDALLQSLAGYVPPMKNVVWKIICKKQIVGYLFSDETAQYQYASAESIKRLSELPSHTVYCKYYHANWGNPENISSLDDAILDRIKEARGK